MNYKKYNMNYLESPAIESFLLKYLSNFDIDYDIRKQIPCKNTEFFETLIIEQFYNNRNLLSMIYKKKNETFIRKHTVNCCYIGKKVSLKDAIDILEENDKKLREVIYQFKEDNLTLRHMCRTL